MNNDLSKQLTKLCFHTYAHLKYKKTIKRYFPIVFYNSVVDRKLFAIFTRLCLSVVIVDAHFNTVKGAPYYSTVDTKSQRELIL